MESFKIEIAELVTCVQPLFGSTREYCKPYLSEKTPEFQIQVSKEDLSAQQAILEEEALAEHLKIRKFTEPFLERTVIQRRIAQQLLEYNTLMLHGSTVCVDGNAYMFTAPCGTGKSTHTRLWRDVFGSRAIMINDDNVFLKITSDCVLAFGSPWNGKHGISTNICAPLKGICLLHRGAENEIIPTGSEANVSLLREQVFTPRDAASAEKIPSLFSRLTHVVPLWEMRCNMHSDAALVSYNAMYGVI